MAALKYYIIESKKQYLEYCDILKDLVFSGNSSKSKSKEREIDLLTLLIETWDREQHPLKALEPIPLLKSLMEDRQMKAKDLVPILGLSKSTISRILNYQISLTRKNIEILAAHFKVRPEAFSQSYDLVSSSNKAKEKALV